MIGKIYWSVFPYYNSLAHRNEYKRRPVLILNGPRNNDFTVLPVSSVPHRENLDLKYDIELIPLHYPNLSLTQTCYIRTHKQTTVHRGDLVACIGDLKTDYPDTYLEALRLLEDFNNSVLNDAL